MKLNSPETARKDVVILAKFSGPHMHAAIWNPIKKTWCVAQMKDYTYTDGLKVSSFDGFLIYDESLTGWLPMPTVDTEGQVVF